MFNNNSLNRSMILHTNNHFFTLIFSQSFDFLVSYLGEGGKGRVRGRGGGEEGRKGGDLDHFAYCFGIFDFSSLNLKKKNKKKQKLKIK